MVQLNWLKSALQNPNVKAFLEMIRHSEGTGTPDGYKMLFGGRLFNDYSSHPHIFFKYKNKAGVVINTSAAGAYQITFTTWTDIQKVLHLPDFSPQSQDIAALYLINEAKAIDDIQAGHFVNAINLVRHIWASLPGAGCHQPEHKLTDVEKWYEDAGGNVIAD